MAFEIYSATYGLKMYDLIKEISEAIEEEATLFLNDYSLSIRIIIRCGPSANKSIIRYTRQRRFLLLDFSLPYEVYEKLYVTERRFELGKSFIDYLQGGLNNRSFKSDNPKFPQEEFLQCILELGQKQGLFMDSVDYTRDVVFD